MCLKVKILRFFERLCQAWDLCFSVRLWASIFVRRSYSYAVSIQGLLLRPRIPGKVVAEKIC